MKQILVVKCKRSDTYDSYDGSSTITIPVSVTPKEVTFDEYDTLMRAVQRWNVNHYQDQIKILTVVPDKDIDEIIAEYKAELVKLEKKRKQQDADAEKKKEERKRRQFEKLKKELGEK